MSAAARLIRILCFGDSLTEGWYRNGFKFHPYTNKLTEIFTVFNHGNVEVINKGISGELVHPEMLKRLPITLDSEEFDFVIILGGTNDLSSLAAAKSNDLFQNIVSLHEIAHAKAIKTCAITIPQSAFDMLPMFAEYVQYREDVNTKIREFASNNSKMVCLCDLSKQLPMFGVSGEDLSKHWDDELHFTPKGYDRLGELIFEVIKDFFIN